MNADATPDSPVPDPADDEAETVEPVDDPQPMESLDSARPTEDEQPAWIEVGSPKRRTAPPAWADEAHGDAWAQMSQLDQSGISPPALQVQLMQQASADSATAPSPAEDQAPHASPDSASEMDRGIGSGDDIDRASEGERRADDVTATDEETSSDEGTATGEESVIDEGTSTDEAFAAGSSALRGVRLRRPARVAQKPPFRRPALRESARTPDSGNDATQVTPPDNGQADPWVQGPTDRPAGDDQTGVLPAVGAEHDTLADEPTVRLDAQTAELIALDGGEEELAEMDAAHDPQDTAELAALDGAAPQEHPDRDAAETPAAPDQPAARTSEADPESGDSWQVVPDSDPFPAEPGPAGADVETTGEPLHVEAPGDAPYVEADGERPYDAPADHTDPALPLPAATAPLPTAPQPQAHPEPVPQLQAQPTPQSEPQPPVQLESKPEFEPQPPAQLEPESEAGPQLVTQPEPTTARRGGAGTLGGAIDVVAPHLRPHRPALIVGLVTLVLSIWLLVALPFPLKYSVDAALATADVDAAQLGGAGPDPGRSLLIAAGILALMVGLQAGLRAVSVSALNRAGGRVAADLRSRLLSHLHRLSPGRDIDSLDRTTLPLIEDVTRLRDLVAHAGPRIAAGLFALASLLVVLLVVEPLAALIVAVTGALYALVSRGSLRQARRKEAGAEADELVLSETAEELLSATRTIQSYGLEARAARGLADAGARAGRSRAAARRVRAVGDFLAELIAGAGVAAVLLLGGPRMSAGAMSPGELTLVIAYVLIAVVLIREVVRHSGTLKPTIAASDRVTELLEHRAGITEPGRTQPIDRVRGEVVFSAINASGPRGPLFDTVSLVIPAGQHVAMLDREGSETSALISYLLRFDQPETGRVLLDRYDTRAVPLADLRRQMAVVQCEPALFTDTVRENIRVGWPQATDDEVVRAARSAGADEFITLLPDGYDTQLPRRGAGLSDGQRRRIAIARALLRDAPIVVLDNADADIVPTERESVRSGLAALVVGRTALIHSREPDNILTTHRVLWLESGEIIEDGDPQQLAKDPDSWLSAWIHTADETAR